MPAPGDAPKSDSRTSLLTASLPLLAATFGAGQLTSESDPAWIAQANDHLGRSAARVGAILATRQRIERVTATEEGE